jgi:hypothetical protein
MIITIILFITMVFVGIIAFHGLGNSKVKEGSLESPLLPVPSVSTGVSVGTTDTLILASSGGRIWAQIANDGANVVYLNVGAAAVVGKGIRLPVGGTFTINAENMYVGALHAIAMTGATNVTVLASQ